MLLNDKLRFLLPFEVLADDLNSCVPAISDHEGVRQRCSPGEGVLSRICYQAIRAEEELRRPHQQ